MKRSLNDYAEKDETESTLAYVLRSPTARKEDRKLRRRGFLMFSELARLAEITTRDVALRARTQGMREICCNNRKYGNVQDFAETLGNNRSAFEIAYMESGANERPMPRLGTKPEHKHDDVEDFAEDLLYAIAYAPGAPLSTRGTKRAQCHREAIAIIRRALEPPAGGPLQGVQDAEPLPALPEVDDALAARLRSDRGIQAGTVGGEANEGLGVGVEGN